PRMLAEQVIGQPQPSRRHRNIERIQSHMPIAGRSRALWFAGKHEHLDEAPIHEIGVQCHGPLKGRDSSVMLGPATDDMCEYELRIMLRRCQVWCERKRECETTALCG